MIQRRRGFTLIELMVVIAIMMILYAGVPDLITQLQGPRLHRAYSDAAMLAAGLWGPNPDYQGFVGDVSIGTATTPASISTTDGIANDLVFPPSGTTFASATNALGVTEGWNGPYAGFDVKGLTDDPWGKPWAVNDQGQVVSDGPDQTAGTADDIVSPVAGPMLRATTGTITLTVRDPTGLAITDPTFVKIVIWQPDVSAATRGTPERLAIDTAASYANDAFDITNVPPGRRAIEVYGVSNLVGSTCDGLTYNSCSGLYGQGVATVIGGGVAALTITLSETTNGTGP